MASIVGRLAPSPTGAQHLGNARTYLLAWLSIRKQSGTCLLRMEDIDSPRVKPHAAQQAIDDLRWLGLDWDAGPDLGGPHAPYVQSERRELYAEALARLRAAERVYPCTCSRTDVAAAASAPHVGQEGPAYPGSCSDRRADDLPTAGPYSWRYRCSGASREFEDLHQGPQTGNPAESSGDFVIYKSDGTPAYQLAVVIDDSAMGVTEAVRGDDLIPSTFRQLELYEFFGATPPRFAHVPLVVGPDGRRLAKRHGDTRLSLLRERHVPPERLIGLLAHSCGLIEHCESISARELIAEFAWSKISRDPFTATETHWKWLLGT